VAVWSGWWESGKKILLSDALKHLKIVMKERPNYNHIHNHDHNHNYNHHHNYNYNRNHDYNHNHDHNYN
jgi:ABC-type Zn2+ transport system substrate-binding protein/surface adhesin